MSKMGEFLTKQTDDELKAFLRETVVLTDDLSLELIKRVGGPHSSLAVTDLPIPNYSEDLALTGLYQLEDLGIVSSKLEKRGEDYIRVFSATPVATRIAQIVSRK